MSVNKLKNLDLRRVMKGIGNEEVLIPFLYTKLNDPAFETFNVKIEGWTDRPPDGYFHPSVHSLWTARQLALYLMAPQSIEAERMLLTSTLAITQGNFWHMFLQHILHDNGEGPLIQDEVGFVDETYRRKGHADGLLNIEGHKELLEIKTMNARTLGKINNEDDLKEFKLQYYAQTQDYLDVFGLETMRYLILNAEYPFLMKEFTVKANVKYQEKRRAIYKQAIDFAATHTYPLELEEKDIPACCTARSTEAKNCPLRRACPIGQL